MATRSVERSFEGFPLKSRRSCSSRPYRCQNSASVRGCVSAGDIVARYSNVDTNMLQSPEGLVKFLVSCQVT